jgi:hypothetical protein
MCSGRISTVWFCECSSGFLKPGNVCDECGRIWDASAIAIDKDCCSMPQGGYLTTKAALERTGGKILGPINPSQAHLLACNRVTEKTLREGSTAFRVW